MKSKLNIIITGGGTGGHLYPGLAIADEILKRTSCQILFIGTRNGLEAQVVPKKGYPFKTVWISGIHRGRIVGNILFPIKMIFSLIQALMILGQFPPDVIIGTGGYVSWPVIVAGILLRKLTVIQEQNEHPGLVNRILSHYVDSVHLSFESSTRFFRKKSNLLISGNPTRESLDEGSREAAVINYQLNPKQLTLFIFGGSQGARAVNNAVINLLPGLMNNKNIQLIWATGPRWFDDIYKKTNEWHDKIRIFPYIHDIEMAYWASDLLICRSGATTIAEITRMGLPAILIPFPGSAGGHQEANARVLYTAGAAEMVLENEIERGKFEKVIFSLLSDHKKRIAMGKRANQFGKPEAVKEIVNDIFSRL
jgi:UDP-N-acetylglucosamine--N-acetylmuramyl-(pentapeptide) pyrophosphoryl-undecaprenol N-acetylglucosamine transferase